MIDTVPRPDATLPQFLAARARHASDGALVLNAAGGFFIGLAALLWRGPAWNVQLTLGVSVWAFGFWGILDRELGERGDVLSGRMLLGVRALRAIVAVLGFAGAAATFLIVLGAALGRMIS